jgi:glycosyltransferase involved in cell wall biosynthesis
MRVAIVHPWYLANGGAEQTVNVLAEMFPEADFFTLFYRPEDLPSNLRGRKVKALSWNWLPAKYHLFRYLLPLYPLAFEALDLRGYDLVLTSDSCVTKCILVDQSATHICYCHSPMRCLWDLRREFSDNMSGFTRSSFALGTHYVRQCDFSAAQRVDAFIANSKNVAERIRKFYRRESILLYPPVNTSKGYIDRQTEEYYLSVGRIVETKRNDLLIAACNKLQRRLIVVGSGREEKRLKSMAGPTIEFAGRVSEERLGKLYARCRALLFAANEDFGIVPVEAQSYGRPVIALGRGGSLETVVGMSSRVADSPTGLYFPEQTVESVVKAIQQFESVEERFQPRDIQKHAAKFDTRNFVAGMTKLVERVMGRPDSMTWVQFPEVGAWGRRAGDQRLQHTPPSFPYDSGEPTERVPDLTAQFKGDGI